MIEITNISKSFGRYNILDKLNWKVRSGEFWGLIGPNGSGKTTLINLISGVEKPDGGQIQLDGKRLDTYSRKALSHKVAVLQQDGLPPVSYSVREVVEMGRFAYQDWRGRELGDPLTGAGLIDRIMERLDLLELQHRPLSVLSGGQRQRAALGKVMAQQPELVLLDEPTTYLDLRYQLQFMDLVADWQRTEGLTVISVMHDLNLAAMYCNRLLVMSGGGIVAEGTPQDILSPDLVAEVFGVHAHQVAHPDLNIPQLLLRRGEFTP